MPIKLNVGASKKIADESYGSRGASVNLEIELDSGLARHSAKLQERIRQLFHLVHQSLAEELTLRRAAESPTGGSKSADDKPSGAARMATPAQVKALFAIAKEQASICPVSCMNVTVCSDRRSSCSSRRASSSMPSNPRTLLRRRDRSPQSIHTTLFPRSSTYARPFHQQ